MISFVLTLIRFHILGYSCFRKCFRCSDYIWKNRRDIVIPCIWLNYINLTRIGEPTQTRSSKPHPSVAYFTKEVHPRLAKRLLGFNGRLANRVLTSLVKEAIAHFMEQTVCDHTVHHSSCRSNSGEQPIYHIIWCMLVISYSVQKL